ncbi:serine/threonine-protein kinase [Embleya sp. NPDC005575]|uniref:serine/threonine-protein kinase n=1 Tax=Embleya sp. NPDC005575 TaxID=3156892 RepID=UPI0033B92BBD
MWGLGTVLGGRYTLAERLGGGAMGEVWRADDGVLERQVAVKILLPALLADVKFAERFRREAKVLAALDHPGIVDVHDYGESGSEPRVAYIVMELVAGRPLDAVMADGEDDGDGAAMPTGRALGIVAQALDALHAAHLRGIVHRDVKPSNLMIGTDDRVTVTDFGIAHSTAETKLTASHAVLGTARYIAPEQARGSGAVPASDQYAIGVLCYELLTGEALFAGDAVFEVLLKHIREPAPELPADFPEAVRALVAKALAKEPEDRYADAAEMADVARAAARGAVAGTPETAVTAVTAVAVAGAVGGDAGAGEANSGTAGAADGCAGADLGADAGVAVSGCVASDGTGAVDADADADADAGDAVASDAAGVGAAAGSAGGLDPASGGADLDKAAAPGGSVSESAADHVPGAPEASAPAAASVATDAPPPAAVPASAPASAAAPGSATASAAVPVAVPAPSSTPPESTSVPRDTTPPPASTRAWKRHGIAAVLLVLGVIAGVVATVVFVQPPTGRSDADRNAPNAQPTATERWTPSAASADPGLGSAPPPTAATGTPSTNAGASQSPGTAQVGGSAGGPVPPPGGTNAGGANGGGANGSASAGAGGSPGGGSGGTQSKPPASTPPPAQNTPQGCGGDRWGAITSVADGRRIGLAADSPTQGKGLIMDGNSQYGWVHSVSTWDTFHTCSLSGPAIGQPYGNSARPELAVGYTYSTNWRLVEAPTSGAVYIKDYAGQNCLTNNGSGKPLSVVDCTPGNKYQQWRIP